MEHAACDPAIYAGGSFPDAPGILAGLRPAPEIETVAGLYPPAAYARPFPRGALFADPAAVGPLEASHGWLGGDEARCPACLLVRVRDGLVRDRGLTVGRGGASRPLYETYRACDLLTLALPGPAGPATDLPDTHAYLLITSSGAFNWGHWLAEDLPRLAAVAALARLGRPVCVLMHAFVPETDRMRAALLGALVRDIRPRVSLRWLRPDTAYRAQALYYATPVAAPPGPKHPAALADLAAAGRGAAHTGARRWWRPARTRARRLFVVRRPGRGRVPEGLDALADALRRRGYAPFDPEGAGAVEQAAAFAAAERVVGCMGAAMVGTLFCAPGTRVLHLAPESFPDPYYLDLAAARGHAYGACYGRPLDPARADRANYALDPGRLAEALAWLNAG